MSEIAAVILCLLILSSVFILLAVLLVVRAAQWIFRAAAKEVLGPADEHSWRRANRFERERMVRRACVWRLLGRVVGAGALVPFGISATSLPS